MTPDLIVLPHDRRDEIMRAISERCDDPTVRMALNKQHKLHLSEAAALYLFELIYQLVIAHHFRAKSRDDEQKAAQFMTVLVHDVDEMMRLVSSIRLLSKGIIAPKLTRDIEKELASFDEQLSDFYKIISTCVSTGPTHRARRGRKRKIRDEMWFHLANVYKNGGGSISAFYDPSKGTVDSPFIAFCRSVLDLLPTEVRRYYSTRLGESIREWHRRKPQPTAMAQGIIFHRPSPNNALSRLRQTMVLAEKTVSQELPCTSKRRRPKPASRSARLNPVTLDMLTKAWPSSQ